MFFYVSFTFVLYPTVNSILHNRLLLLFRSGYTVTLQNNITINVIPFFLLLQLYTVSIISGARRNILHNITYIYKNMFFFFIVWSELYRAFNTFVKMERKKKKNRNEKHQHAVGVICTVKYRRHRRRRSRRCIQEDNKMYIIIMAAAAAAAAADRILDSSNSRAGHA